MAKMTKEELNSMIAEQVKAAVASALETKAAPPAAHEEGDGSNASGTKGAPAAAAVQRAMALLKEGKLRVYEVAEAVGYKDITYFSGTFKKLTGMSPTEYQNANF